MLYQLSYTPPAEAGSTGSQMGGQAAPRKAGGLRCGKRRGGDEKGRPRDDAAGPVDREARPAQPAKHQRRMAFWAWRRFSASSKITECGPSMTSEVASSSRCAGRQCMNSASGAALAISAALT